MKFKILKTKSKNFQQNSAKSKQKNSRPSVKKPKSRVWQSMRKNYIRVCPLIMIGTLRQNS